MSHEAVNKTTLEYKKQKKDMDDVNLEISRLEKLRDKEQKTLDSKRSERVELETKITKNVQEQKKALPQNEKDALISEKVTLDAGLAKVQRDIPIFTSIVEDYNQRIDVLKKSKDTIEPKLSSAKKESRGERIAHFIKKNWAALAASSILAGGMVGAYEYGKNSSGNNKNETEKHVPITPPKDQGKDTSNKSTPATPPKDNIKDTSINYNKDTTAHYNDGVNKDKGGNGDRNTGGSRRKKETPKVDEKDSSPKVTYKIINPDGTKEKIFNTKEERDAFVKGHNEVLHENSNVTPTPKPGSTPASANLKAEYKLVSPDGKQTKIFNTREERKAFADEHKLQIKED